MLSKNTRWLTLLWSHHKRWNDTSKARWESLCVNGMRHYILWHGVLFWGLWCGSGTGIMTILFSDSHNGNPAFILGIHLAIFLPAGALYGYGTWHGTMQSYRDTFKTEPPMKEENP